MHDVIIIGAGSAGATLASRLTEDPDTSVLLLEAGGPDRSLDTRIPAAFNKTFRGDLDWDYTTTPQPGLGGRRLYWPRGKVIGGSSAINAMMWVRGNPADYDSWAAAGCDGWSYDELVPHFAAAEDTERPGGPEVGVGGPLAVREQRDPNPATRAFVEACVAAGIPRNDHPNERGNDGVSLTQVTQRNGARQSVATAYLDRRVRRRPNLAIVPHAHVHRVLVEDGRATGVEVVVAGRERTALARREVIVAAGAVNSPQLLLLSGIGPAGHLVDHGIDVVVDAPDVGSNLLDHLASAIVVGTDRADTLTSAERPATIAQWLLRRRGPLTSNVGEAHAFLRTTDGLDAPDIELVFAPVPFVDHGLEPPRDHGYTVAAVLLAPRSRGTIRLRDADPTTPVEIDPCYLSQDRDAATLVTGLRRATELVATPPLADLVSAPLVPPAWPTTDEGWRAHLDTWAETLYHPAGTARMGVDDRAVVTPDLRVRGVEGLRVADVSIMPTLNTGHTNAVAVMIGEKCADLVRAAS